MFIATLFVYALYLYLLVGLLFGLWFVLRGGMAVDGGLREASWPTRLLLRPGSAALWPVLWLRYRGRAGSGGHTG